MSRNKTRLAKLDATTRLARTKRVLTIDYRPNERDVSYEDFVAAERARLDAKGVDLTIGLCPTSPSRQFIECQK